MKISDIHNIFLRSDGIATDSRKDVKNKVFVCLKGENFDGNDFALQALNHGAAFVISDRVGLVHNDRLIVVEDALSTLQNLANYHRHYLAKPLLAITGSNGKTTTKELIRLVLNSTLSVHATQGNFNNLIGVPLTILGGTPDHDLLLIEMGSNALGEIEKLCEIAEPDFGLITNVGAAHIEGFDSLEGVFQEKTALFRAVGRRKGTIFVPTCDERLHNGKYADVQRIEFGIDQDNVVHEKVLFVQLHSVVPQIDGQISFSQETAAFRSALMGIHNAENCLAAIAIGIYFKVPIEHIKSAIAQYVPENNRSQIINRQSTTILLDAYNANPVSMERALDVLKSWPKPRKMAIIGDMKELGESSKEAHRNLQNMVKKIELDACFFVGEEFRKSGAKGYLSAEDLIEYFQANEVDFSNAIVLVKGSRSVGLERVLPHLAIDVE